VQRIKINGEVYQIRPSLIMPYHKIKTEDAEKGLYMYHSGASFEAVSNNYGKDAMFWYRLFISLGKYSIVGTTVKSKVNLPLNLLADEKHTWLNGEKQYIATTVSKGCFLGSELSDSPSEKGLTQAYKIFKQEVEEIAPEYSPISVNTDGWDATRKSWKNNYPKIILIQCILHTILKYRRDKDLTDEMWNCYDSENEFKFFCNVKKLQEKYGIKVEGFCSLEYEFSKYYHVKEGYRTSNMLDRIMRYQDKFLFNSSYLHGDKESANLFVRAISIMWNFHPYGKRTKRHSPFADLNGFVYHQSWLQNFLIATSLVNFYPANNKI